MEAGNANAGVPVVIFTQPPASGNGAHPYCNARKDLIRKMPILGSFQIALGALCIIFQIVAIVLESEYFLNGLTFIGYGIWNGAIFITSGAIGCVAGRRNIRGLMITFNVMSIVSASINVFLIVFAVLSAVIHSSYQHYIDFYQHEEPIDRGESNANRASIAMESLMAALAVAEIVVAIWSSVVCCQAGACCCDCGDACCCPPAPVSTQIIMMQPRIDGEQQTALMYTTNVAQHSAGNRPTYQDNKHHPEFPYQQLVTDPTVYSEADIDDGDRAKLFV